MQFPLLNISLVDAVPRIHPSQRREEAAYRLRRALRLLQPQEVAAGIHYLERDEVRGGAFRERPRVVLEPLLATEQDAGRRRDRRSGLVERPVEVLLERRADGPGRPV